MENSKHVLNNRTSRYEHCTMQTQRNLRNLLIAAGAVLIMATSCGNNTEPKAATFQGREQAVFLLYDISRSTDSFGRINKQDIDYLFVNMAVHGGGTIYTGYIQANSLRQETGVFVVPALRLEVKGNNFYDNQEIDNVNRQRKKALQAQASLVTAQIFQVLSRPKTEGSTDLRNALTLAAQTLASPACAEKAKTLLILSDCVQATGQPDWFKAESIPRDTRIAVVRPNPAIVLESIFGRNPEVYSSAGVAFKSISHP